MSAPTPPRQRRQWLVLAVIAAGAGTLGAWLSQRQQMASSPTPAVPDSSPPAPDTPYPDLLPDVFWQLSFSGLDGQAMPMSTFKGKPLVINFWATWCPPCVKELPMLDQFARQMSPQGWRVLGLASDQLAAVQAFLKQSPVSFDMALADMDGIQLAKQLGNTAGGLPFSVVIDAQGRVRTRKMGAIQGDDLPKWVAAVSAP